ncbi:cytochrome bd oxidase small subunit, CydX/CbdX family [Photobacterium sp. DNB22_13_2]
MWYLIWIIGLAVASYFGIKNGFRMERNERHWKDNQAKK